MMKKRIAVLGATGSIGSSALDVISRDMDNFEVVLLSAHCNREKIEKLKLLWSSAVCVLTSEDEGKKKLIYTLRDIRPDITINGIATSAGLEPSLAAIEAGSTLALANKETIVMAGQFILKLAKEKNVKIIPVDSEHSAIFHLMKDRSVQEISEIILTASGGPFRKLSLEEMKKVTAKDALSHPTWKMGKKITIDSASMANKGLEIIEACYFFDMPVEKIKVVIHPQSIVHSMICLCNGTLYAQLSKPDMRYPISDALYFPKTSVLNFENLEFDSLNMEFEKPDQKRFPMLRLAYEAVKQGGLYSCAYNAANEEAVNAFLNNKAGFLDIPKITSHVLESDWSLQYSDIQTVLKTDADARMKAIKYIKKME
jgi:1-deoxy-D-xylulose-5-phosphate reductoisomerase